MSDLMKKVCDCDCEVCEHCHTEQCQTCSVDHYNFYPIQEFFDSIDNNREDE